MKYAVNHPYMFVAHGVSDDHDHDNHHSLNHQQITENPNKNNE